MLWNKNIAMILAQIQKIILTNRPLIDFYNPNLDVHKEDLFPYTHLFAF